MNRMKKMGGGSGRLAGLVYLVLFQNSAEH